MIKLTNQIKALIFSDLDGTILSREDYSAKPSLDAFVEAQKIGIQIIIVSSKTKAEIENLQTEFGWRVPFISENGGGIYFPISFKNVPLPDQFVIENEYHKYELGKNYKILCSALSEIERELNLEILSFSKMNPDQIATVTDLPIEKAILAKQREFDEPFLVNDSDVEKLPLIIDKIYRRGLHYTKGGRFHHILSDFDKGRTVKYVIEIFRKYNNSITTAAVGDAQNDLPMFEQVDFPFLVRKPDGSFEEDAMTSNIYVTTGIGPIGFAEAISLIIEKLENIK